MSNFIVSFWVVYVLITWFKTTAFVEYYRLFRLGWLFDDSGYKGMKDVNFSLTYPEFIASRHCNFTTRLLNCPLCLAVWIQSGLWFCFNTNISYFAPDYLLSIVLYYVVCKVIDYHSET